MTKIKLERDKSQETGNVFGWYESEDGEAIVSIVEGNNPKNVEWRVSNKDKSQTFLGSKEGFKRSGQGRIKRKAEQLVNNL